MAVTKRTRYEVLRRPALTGRAGRGGAVPRSPHDLLTPPTCLTRTLRDPYAASASALRSDLNAGQARL